jgi:hypothetical protein
MFHRKSLQTFFQDFYVDSIGSFLTFLPLWFFAFNLLYIYKLNLKNVTADITSVLADSNS